MTVQSQYEWNQERDYNRQLEAAELEDYLADLTEDELADYKRREEEAAGY